MNARMSLVLASFAAALSACADGPETVVHTEEGDICLSQSAGELKAVVPLNQCLSASCDTERQSECSIALEADGIRVHSRFSYRRAGSGSCTADCGLLAARCSMPLPADGTYAVLLGDQGGEITLPLTVSVASVFPTEGGPGGTPCTLFRSSDSQEQP
jgi:hypothetical protein